MSSCIDGCDTCKKRRVKCDGARPNCGSCRRANRVCFGSLQRVPQKPTEFAFILESVTPQSQGKATPIPRKKKYGRQKRVAAREQRLEFSSLPSAIDASEGIPSSLAVSLAEQAIAYYFQQHVVPPMEFVEATQEYMDYLPLMWMRSTEDSEFRLAMLAASYSAFGKAKMNQIASQESKRMYYQAVSRINKLLSDPVHSCSDQILLATMLLCSYEKIAWDYTCDDKCDRQIALAQHIEQTFCHHNGAVALLGARQQRDPSNQRNLILDKLVRRELLPSLRFLHTETPIWLMDGTFFGESGLPLQLERWMSRLLYIQHEVDVLLQNKNPVPDTKFPFTAHIKHLIEEANNVDSEMLLWATHPGPELCYQTHTIGSALFQDMPFCSVVHTYSSISYAAIWNQYRGTRIHLRSTVVRLLLLLESHYKSDIRQSIETEISTIRALNDDICASVPFSTGQIVVDRYSKNGGYIIAQDYEQEKYQLNKRVMSRMAFPLFSIASCLDIIDMSYIQKIWVRTWLLCVSRASHYKLLEELTYIRVAIQ